MESHVSQRTRDPSTPLRAGYGAPQRVAASAEKQVPHRAFSPIRNDKGFEERAVSAALETLRHPKS